MINLTFFLLMPLFVLGLMLAIANYGNRLNIRLIVMDDKFPMSQVEEYKNMLPSIIRTFFQKLNDFKFNLISYFFKPTHWVENSEVLNEKEQTLIKRFIILVLKKIALSYSLLMFVAILIVWSSFNPTILEYQFISNAFFWLNMLWNLGINLAIDALSLPFVLLTGFIFPLVYLSNWVTIHIYDIYYLSIILLLESSLILVFLVTDSVVFYVFFESILPLLFILIGIYGAVQKFRAGYYLFLYTLSGSLFMLVSFLKMGADIATTFFSNQINDLLFELLQLILWIVLFISFSVKTPVVPFHIWLPLAHSDANVSGSIVLASVVLKLALYAFIRILIGILCIATLLASSFVLSMAGISILYSSFTTIRQFDLKVLVAYSSIAHMGSTLLGTFSNTLYGLLGSIIFGLAHGFVSPALFILVGAVLYDRCGSRIINYYKGLTNILPIFALMLLLFIFGNMGVPLTGNFIGEFLSLLGAYQQNIFITVIGTTSVILSAVYSIFMYNRITSGSLSPYIHTIPDLFRKEFYLLLPLLILTLILGIYPQFITSDIEFGLSSFLLLGITPVVFQPNSNTDNNNNNVFSNDSDDDVIWPADVTANPHNTPIVRNVLPEVVRTRSNNSGSITSSRQNVNTENNVNNGNNEIIINNNQNNIVVNTTNSEHQGEPMQDVIVSNDNNINIISNSDNKNPETDDINNNLSNNENIVSNSSNSNSNSNSNLNINPSSDNNNLNNNSQSELESQLNEDNINMPVGNPDSEEGQPQYVSLEDPKNKPVEYKELLTKVEDVYVEQELKESKEDWDWVQRIEINTKHCSTEKAINKAIENRNKNESDNNNNINNNNKDNNSNKNINNISNSKENSGNSNIMHSVVEDSIEWAWLDWIIDNFNIEGVYLAIGFIGLILYIVERIKFRIYKWQLWSVSPIFSIIKNNGFNSNSSSNLNRGSNPPSDNKSNEGLDTSLNETYRMSWLDDTVILNRDKSVTINNFDSSVSVGFGYTGEYCDRIRSTLKIWKNEKLIVEKPLTDVDKLNKAEAEALINNPHVPRTTTERWNAIMGGHYKPSEPPKLNVRFHSISETQSIKMESIFDNNKNINNENTICFNNSTLLFDKHNINVYFSELLLNLKTYEYYLLMGIFSIILIKIVFYVLLKWNKLLCFKNKKNIWSINLGFFSIDSISQNLYNINIISYWIFYFFILLFFIFLFKNFKLFYRYIFINLYNMKFFLLYNLLPYFNHISYYKFIFFSFISLIYILYFCYNYYFHIEWISEFINNLFVFVISFFEHFNSFFMKNYMYSDYLINPVSYKSTIWNSTHILFNENDSNSSNINSMNSDITNNNSDHNNNTNENNNNSSNNNNNNNNENESENNTNEYNNGNNDYNNNSGNNCNDDKSENNNENKNNETGESKDTKVLRRPAHYEVKDLFNPDAKDINDDEDRFSGAGDDFDPVADRLDELIDEKIELEEQIRETYFQKKSSAQASVERKMSDFENMSIRTPNSQSDTDGNGNGNENGNNSLKRKRYDDGFEESCDLDKFSNKKHKAVNRMYENYVSLVDEIKDFVKEHNITVRVEDKDKEKDRKNNNENNF